VIPLCAYKKLKQYAPAIAAFEKAVALEPMAEWADSARESICDLRKQ
jgi:hypothetical protein